jgi:hypothetical protein
MLSAARIFPFNINKLPIDGDFGRWKGAAASCSLDRTGPCTEAVRLKTAEA